MRTNRASRRRRGNAIVEFALSAGILTTAFTGVFQFGYSMYIYNELESAVRAGVRYASLAKISNSGDRTVPTSFNTAVKNMVVYGTPSPGQNPTSVAPGLTTNNVSNVTVTWDSGNVPTSVSVSINSYTVDAVFKTFTFAGKPRLTMPYFGEYCSNGSTC
jgi:Flp pilus assembly protein TadG